MASWDSFWQQVGTHIVGPIVIGTAISLVLLLKEWREKRKTKLSIRMSAEKNEKIERLLLEIRIRLAADRCYLALYHNGNKYIEGSEIIKASRTNESAAPGVSLEAHDYQSILISLISDENKLVAEEGPSFTKVDQLADGTFKRKCESIGVRAVARCAIRRGNDIIGFVGLDYNDDIEKPTNIVDLCKYAGILEQILTDYRSK